MVDLSLHILDVATNAFKASAKNLKVVVLEDEKFIKMTITDDGCGMSEETVKNVINPFYTTRKTRKVGLGLPLFRQTLEQTGGFLKITSKLGFGTTIEGLMYTNHIDAIPLGDIGESIFVLVTNPYDVDVHFEMIFKDQNKEKFVIDTKEIKEVLDGVPLSENSVMLWIKEFIQEGLC